MRCRSAITVSAAMAIIPSILQPVPYTHAQRLSSCDCQVTKPQAANRKPSNSRTAQKTVSGQIMSIMSMDEKSPSAKARRTRSGP